MRVTSMAASVAMVAIGLGAAGCKMSAKGANIADPVPVSGKVVFSDKTPLRGGIVIFHPVERVDETGALRYDPAGVVDAQGNFKVGYNGDGSGAPPGDYKVTVEPREVGELGNSNSRSIPFKYREAGDTPLLKTVPENGATFELIIEKK